MKMTPIEREYYIEFIQEEAAKTKELFEKQKNEHAQKVRNKR